MRVGYLIVLVAIVNLLLDDLHTHDDAMCMDHGLHTYNG